MTSPRLHVTFVCTGNICRSPMGEQMLRSRLETLQLEDQVRVTSAGTTRWEVGNPIDDRADSTLVRHGLPSFSDHTAKYLTEDHLSADLVLALANDHYSALSDLGVGADRLRLVRSFDPESEGSEVADPYYGNSDEFETTYTQIDASLPGIISWLQPRLS